MVREIVKEMFGIKCNHLFVERTKTYKERSDVKVHEVQKWHEGTYGGGRSGDTEKQTTRPDWDKTTIVYQCTRCGELKTIELEGKEVLCQNE